MPEKQTMERDRRQGKAGHATGSRTTAKHGRAAAKSGSRHASTAAAGGKRRASAAPRAKTARAATRSAGAGKQHASTASGAKRTKKWSAGVMARSDAMDLETGVFKLRSAKQVALSLKRSVEASHRRKSPPFRSAMSMLNFEINRGGKNLSAERLRVLNRAKDELRKVFHREPAGH